MCGRAGRSRLCPSAQLEALHPQFASIDSLPLLGLPLTTIPWILLAPAQRLHLTTTALQTSIATSYPAAARS